jgi:hypothetical protein
MKLIGLGSVRGAPGATTSSLLIASALPGPTLVLEADLHGGVLAARYGLGREPGLTTLAAAGALSADEWQEHAQDAGGVPVIVGPDDPIRARSIWRRAEPRIGQALRDCEATCVVDLGRINEESPLSSELALLVVLVRPIPEHLVTLAHQLPALRHAASRIGVVLTGTGEYRATDVADALEVEVIGSLPHDPRAASMLVRGGQRWGGSRTPLYRSISTVAGTVDAALASISLSGLRS